ncbi:MAG: carboxypeptidase regulatory-like domain-containing protein, partial [Chloroflexi bacterium]|nr:carboxypeptidase regulatory-like domain-containing protein [Chloroflexota bacterium]
MQERVCKLVWTAVLVTMMVMTSALAYAQGGATSTLSGVVVDTSGGVVPGADIIVKDVATGAVFNAVSGGNGAFTIPAIPPGTYTVTIALQGFKTVELTGIVVNVAVQANVKAVLGLGEITETVVVTGAQEIVQTQATSVASTMNVKQISNLPMLGRGAFDIIGYMPGVVTNTGSLRDGTINGLPQSTVNITLDGMNIQDNYAKTWDGMFTRVTPRLDAIEEVTVSTAASSADMAGQGAAQVRYVTRSGTNRYQGSTYFYYRRTWMNTNTWWNINRNVDTTGKITPTARTFYDYPGARFGGPIIKDKAFFFVNYEWVNSPGTRTDTRTIMSPLSERGQFQYSGGTIDLMALAASKGQMATIDPTIAKLLADVRSSTSQGTVTTSLDPLVQSFAWQQPTKSRTKYPTFRLDYQMTSKHRLSFSMTQNLLLSDPDTTNSRQRIFPGFQHTGLQDSERYTWQVSARSVLTRNMVNEVRVGGTGGRTLFSPNTTPEMYSNTEFGDMKGYNIVWSSFKSISNAGLGTGYSAREGLTKVGEDTLSWLKGKHSITTGASITRGDVWLLNKANAPTVTLGRATGDPADAMFTTANFPGASGTDLTNARNLYSVLTGRITSIGREARIGEDGKTYTILGESMQLGRMWQMGFFVQDGWRLRPDLTMNAGVRYELALPFYARNNSLSTATIADLFGRTGTGSGLVVGSTVTNIGNLFKPGVQEGSPTTYTQLTKGKDVFKTDLNNLAPSYGMAWTTGSETGLWHKILGSHGDTVVLGWFNIAYQRGGMSDFTEVYGGNPGIAIYATRNLTNGNLGTLPVLLRSSDPSAPAVQLERVYPMSVPSASSNVVTFDPDIKTPWALTGTIGVQRALTKEMAVEVRFVHSDSHGGWTLGNTSVRLNYNE